MATKTATKKKTTTRKPAAKKTSKRSELPIGIYKEAHPENHVATGKYKVFFVMFGILMVAFAALAVQLFVFSSELLNKYEEVVECQSSSTCNRSVKNTSVNTDADVVDNTDEE